MLGRVEDGVPRNVDPRYRTNKHVLTCAPTGAGKGIGCVIPNLLSYPGACVVLDVKGENWAVTRNARRRAGQECVALDPFKVTGEASARINPLAMIDLADEACYSDAVTLVDWLVIRTGGDGQAHWDESGAALLQCLVLHVASLPPERRHLGTVREILMMPEAEHLALLDELTREAAAFGRIARLANGYLGKPAKERASVLSTAQRHTTWLEDPRVSRTLEGAPGASLDFRSLKRRPVTVYVVIPPDMLASFRGWVRVVLGFALRELVRDRQQPETPVLVLVDEMPQLEYFKPLEDGVSLLRGYGVTLWLLVQDLSQLQAVYPRWKSFLANSVLQAFGTQDLDTAQYISAMVGQTTVESVSTGKSSGRGLMNTTTSTSRTEQGRALMMPDEIRRLPPERVIVLEQGKQAMFLERLDYLHDPELAGLGDPNPMYGAVQTRKPVPVPEPAAPMVSRRPGERVPEE
jgi:type IV secretory pathway TraG/TraD family ATPase VirD4